MYDSWNDSATASASGNWNSWIASSASTANCTIKIIHPIYIEDDIQWYTIPQQPMGTGGDISVWNVPQNCYHSPDTFIYMPNETEIPQFGPTQHLAPIDECLEIVGFDKVIDHYQRLLSDVAYREMQLHGVNLANPTGVEVWWTPELEEIVRCKLADVIKAKADAKVEAEHRLEIEAKATELFNNVFGIEEIQKLELGQLVIVSRDGLTFELDKNGEIYQLLPNGEKHHWCVVAKGHPHLPLKDILVMKKLLIENAPELIINPPN